jgi:hypothetical protein
MSSLLGGPGARLPLDRAVDELTASGRWAGRPGLVWLAGIFYPSLIYNLGAVLTVVHLFQRALERDLGLWFFDPESMRLPLLPFVSVGGPREMVGVSLVMILPALVVYRLNVGLAAIAAPGAESAADGADGARTLRAAWRAGRGQARPALGMWLALMGLLVAMLTILFGPTLLIIRLLALDAVPALVTVLVAPAVCLVLGYAAVLLALHMLALQSLAQNRRGVSSALTHAWRLVRAEPWGAVRACLVDLSLQVLLLAAIAAAGAGLRITLIAAPLAGLVQVALLAVAGVTRAAFWSRVYRALGGPLRTDRMPGLVSTEEPSTARLAEPPGGRW